ncbi:hypothetical protein SAMN02745157_4455 [Kaistia soli DSM 19436]|uniref:Uncharacterized protein n=1 Tax=Kaistia soli DSM 19436 TaxID=1122133 RepID=A0A1M5L0H7_9HYPH|nr:hypothetical protein [Kaistia soli]SHG58496.1 hypothetical protein SAMN02745157_4455 [Kaistia soli DSM 19436]
MFIRIAGALELLTGLGLVLLPDLVSRLIFGIEVADLGVAFARIAGIALLSLSVACAPRSLLRDRPPTLAAMLALNAMLAVYLGVIGVLNIPAGILFWPAVAVHAVLALLLAAASYFYRPEAERRPFV